MALPDDLGGASFFENMSVGYVNSAAITIIKNHMWRSGLDFDDRRAQQRLMPQGKL